MLSGNKFIKIFFYITSLAPPAMPQLRDRNPLPEDEIENVIGFFIENIDDEQDMTALYDDLNYLRDNPLNINLAKEEDLLMLHVLNDYQINSLLDYIKIYGYLTSIYELQYIYGFSEDLTRLISPFIIIKPDQNDEKNIPESISLKSHNTVFIRQNQTLEKQKGYDVPDSSSNYYFGRPVKIYSRYQYNFHNKILWGVTGEKDAGEEFFTGSNKAGFDFYSAHLQINTSGTIKTFVMGDYCLQFGQGLALWQGLNMSKSNDIGFIKKNPQCVKRYISSDENNFFRGAAMTIGIKNLNLSLFYSRNRIDASVLGTDSLSNETRKISSIINTGSHATPGEIKNEDAVQEIAYGGNLMYRFGKFRTGITFLSYSYNVPLAPEISPSNFYYFAGKQNIDCSFDYQYNTKQISVFGEATISKNMKPSWINGIVLQANPSILFSVLYRNYDPAYHAFHASSFAENSNPVNENGIYLGTKFLPFSHWDVSAFWDTFSFPWMSYSFKAPSNGYHYMAHVNYTPATNVSMYWRLTQKNKPVEISPGEGKTSLLTKYLKTNFRFHITYSSVKNWYFKNRVEISKYTIGKNTNEDGFLLFQDIEYKPEVFPLAISARYAIFSTDSYNTRIYAYEDDALYHFSVPSYFDKGTRVYLNVKYTINSWAKLWIKLSQTYYENKSIISSGLNEIEGNKKTDVTFQVRLKF